MFKRINHYHFKVITLTSINRFYMLNPTRHSGMFPLLRKSHLEHFRRFLVTFEFFCCDTINQSIKTNKQKTFILPLKEENSVIN